MSGYWLYTHFSPPTVSSVLSHRSKFYMILNIMQLKSGANSADILLRWDSSISIF